MLLILISFQNWEDMIDRPDTEVYASYPFDKSIY